MKFSIRYIEETTSTNDEVIKDSKNWNGKTCLVVRSARQTSGRGRFEHSWESPSGNLYFSMFFKPSLEQKDWGKYSIVSALAVSDVVNSYFKAEPQSSNKEDYNGPSRLKWPNDVFVGGKKISGIFLQCSDEGLLVGIGVNVKNTPSISNKMYNATSLCGEGAKPSSVDEVFDKLLDAFNGWTLRLEQEGFSFLRKEWLNRAQQGSMEVHLPKRSDPLNGSFAGLDPDGHLLIVDETGKIHKILAGDVFAVPEKQELTTPTSSSYINESIGAPQHPMTAKKASKAGLTES